MVTTKTATYCTCDRDSDMARILKLVFGTCFLPLLSDKPVEVEAEGVGRRSLLSVNVAALPEDTYQNFLLRCAEYGLSVQEINETVNRGYYVDADKVFVVKFQIPANK